MSKLTLVLGFVASTSVITMARATGVDEYLNGLTSDARKRESQTQGHWVDLNKVLNKLPTGLTPSISKVRDAFNGDVSNFKLNDPKGSLEIIKNRLAALRELRTTILHGRISGTRAENSAIDAIEVSYQQELVNANTYQTIFDTQTPAMVSCFKRLEGSVVNELQSQNDSRRSLLKWRDNFDRFPLGGAAESAKYYGQIGNNLENYFTATTPQQKKESVDVIKSNLETPAFSVRRSERGSLKQLQTNQDALDSLCKPVMLDAPAPKSDGHATQAAARPATVTVVEPPKNEKPMVGGHGSAGPDAPTTQVSAATTQSVVAASTQNAAADGARNLAAATTQSATTLPTSRAVVQPTQPVEPLHAATSRPYSLSTYDQELNKSDRQGIRTVSDNIANAQRQIDALTRDKASEDAIAGAQATKDRLLKARAKLYKSMADRERVHYLAMNPAAARAEITDRLKTLNDPITSKYLTQILSEIK